MPGPNPKAQIRAAERAHLRASTQATTLLGHVGTSKPASNGIYPFVGPPLGVPADNARKTHAKACPALEHVDTPSPQVTTTLGAAFESDGATFSARS